MKVPSPGESIKEVEIATWLVKDGDYVEKDQAIAEVDSDKATLESCAPELRLRCSASSKCSYVRLLYSEAFVLENNLSGFLSASLQGIITTASLIAFSR